MPNTRNEALLVLFALALGALLIGCTGQVDVAPDAAMELGGGSDSGLEECTPNASCIEEVEEQELSCENPPTEPLIPVELLLECCDGARCVPMAFVPEEEVRRFELCGENDVCVPEAIIETQGFFTLETCESIGGLEGRCASICLVEIAEQLDVLPQSSCAANERCAPCWDPFTGEDLGTCAIACDPGPATVWEPVFATCCDDGSGHCIPSELVPDDQEENLGAESCIAGSLCVPDVVQDPAFQGTPCLGENFLTGPYDGVCLPDCLELPLELTLDDWPCPDHYICVPCQGIFGESTGAPGCP